ncbi:hypothetical protein IV203_015239 [Nitzschia inconspicua]|uniref:Uncharacterized protein n=1 Tax=Nitzschia inconspicua TaxID=303405 RepID=A0A9K3LBD7_9STRA|nr:hypothetical protein IV203_015239 [Nitzschia inconspicua]
MMMSKPKPEEEEELAPPAFATPPPPAKVGTVEDLQYRLSMLGNEVDNAEKKPAAVATNGPSSAAAMEAPAAIKGGKNALLARIMAAKEKSQQAKVAPAPPAPPTVDLLMNFDAPSTEKDPPPSYDTNFLAGMAPPPPAVDAPPAFDAVESNLQQSNVLDFPPPPPIDSVMPPPPPMDNILPPPPEDPMMMMMPNAPAASAPSFEDLLGGSSIQQEFHPPPMAPPTFEETQSAALDIDESILNALDPAEREAFLEEQRKIMEQIEQEKMSKQAPGSAAARAAAFDQRSSAAVAQVAASYEGSSRSRPKPKSSSSRGTANRSAGRITTVNLGEGTEVPLHGQEKTQKAIEDGTAVIVQCMSCSNWMQVTVEAEVMFCPICQTVCHVEKTGAATTADMEAAAQLAADAELAEKLQKEEYARAGGDGGGTRRRTARTPAPAPAAEASSGQSWYDWLTGAPAPAPAPASSARSAEIRPQRGLVAATTGEEGGVGRSRSYDESEGLMGRGGARVAQQKSMFACVADSITDAANQMTAFTLSEDQEGNVHGVDSSSLLAMPDVSRRRDNESL